MQKILYYVWMLALVAACNKQGPDGPAGPEGPQGNPGPPGNSAGTGNGTVMAYTTGEKNVFRWEKNDNKNTGYSLTRASSAGSPNYDAAFYVRDDEQVIPSGVVLVYVKMKKATSTQEAAWIGMPFIGGNNAVGEENFQAWLTYRDQTGNNDYLAVQIHVDVEQPTPAATKMPTYAASGVKVIVIPAGIVWGGEEGRAADLKTLSLEQVMERYQLKETDFKTLQ